MRGLLASLLLGATVLVPGPLRAQQDDRSYLEAFLEDSLSGAGRVVTVQGFEGALSSTARIDSVTVADGEGVWLTLTGIDLDWSRSALLQGRIAVDRLSAQTIRVERPPVAADQGPQPEAADFSLPELPVSIDIGVLAAERIELGAAVLGQPVVARLDASARLAGGEGQARLTLDRVDAGPRGRLLFDGGFSNDTRQLDLTLRADEAAGGLAVQLLGVPGQPAAALTVEGAGPLSDFTARIALSTGDAERLGGTVSLTGQDGGDTAFAADLSGDLAPLFLPDYAAFFGPDIALTMQGARRASGALQLDRFSLSARALALSGQVSLSADGLPDAFAVTGELADPDGASVLLPLAGDSPVRLDRAAFSLAFDGATDEGWRGEARVDGLDTAPLRAQTLTLSASGRIARQAGARTVGATVDLAGNGLSLADPALTRAMGPAVSGRVLVLWREGSGLLQVPVIRLQAGDATVAGAGTIDGLASGYRTTVRADVSAGSLARFSALAGQDLGGGAKVSLTGEVVPLTGGFDLRLTGEGRDLAVGIAELDRALRGTTRLVADARRDGEGTLLRDLSITAPGFSATVGGRLATVGSDLKATASIPNLSLLGPGYGGGLTAGITFAGTGADGGLAITGATSGLRLGQPDLNRLIGGKGTLDVKARLRGDSVEIEQASLSTAEISARATGSLGPNGQAITLQARLNDLGLIVTGFPGALEVQGTLRGDGRDLGVEARVSGPGGVDARVAGTVAPAFDRVALSMTGTLDAALANPFLRPRTVSGRLAFDLGLNGRPGLGALSGRVTLAGGRLSEPSAAVALTDLAGTADLAGGQLKLNVNGALSNRGGVTLGGTVGLAAPYPADLRIGLARAVLRDPKLYETRLNADLALTGAIGTGARLSGEVALVETELRIPNAPLAGGAGLPDIRHLAEPAAVRQTRRWAGLLEDIAAGTTGSARPLSLDLVVTAPNRLFLRGRGLDLEMGGSLRLGGTTEAVVPSGGFELVRGRMDILGRRLEISTARLQLEGDLVPVVQIEASTTNNGITTLIAVEGPADGPEISFSSSPELPEEEALAQLLFGRDLQSLSAVQAAQLAAAVASLAGRGGDGIVERLRKGFGLDNLDLRTGEDGTAALTAGKYISRNAYTEVEVDQNGKSQINLNLDIRPGVSVRARAGSDGQTGLGVFIEKDY